MKKLIVAFFVLFISFNNIARVYLAEGMIAGSWTQNARFVNYTNLPCGYQNSLTCLNNIDPNQNKIMVDNGWASSGGLNSALDVYCFKTNQLGESIFADVISFKLKLDFATELSNGQKQIGINLGGTFTSPGGGTAIGISQKSPAPLTGSNIEIWNNYFKDNNFTINTLDKMHLELVDVKGAKEVRMFVQQKYP